MRIASDKVGLRVLCISPRFAPSNAADMHRLRLLLPHLSSCGCAIEVLAVQPSDVANPQDHWLADQLPRGIPIHRVRAWPLSGWGVNGLAQRSFVPLYKKGNMLLRDGKFDLVFFSTTEFLLHGLGPLWQYRWGVPYCMDYQDPWVNEYYQQNPHIAPPGGRLKHYVASMLHSVMERAVVRRCSGFLSVSNAYFTTLDRRYAGNVVRQPRLLAAFPGEPNEWTHLAASEHLADLYARGPIWRYVGRGGADMAFAAKAFFMAWRSAMDDGLSPAETQFEALGTSYAAAGSGVKTIQPLASEFGLAPSVVELPDRLNYSEMLQRLRRSDALVVFGSDDPSYTASKIYPYLLSGKPLLAIFHEKSSVVELMGAAKGGVCVTFNEQTTLEQLAEVIRLRWFASGQFNKAVPLDEEAFEPYTATTQAKAVCDWFHRTVAHAN